MTKKELIDRFNALLRLRSFYRYDRVTKATIQKGLADVLPLLTKEDKRRAEHVRRQAFHRDRL